MVRPGSEAVQAKKKMPKSKMSVHFSSEKHDWETPSTLFNQLNKEFNFTLDVCANESNAKCENYFSPETDGLSKKWSGTCWMNPPYGRRISKWIQKAHDESKKGCDVVCLIPSRTDTKYWHDYCMKAAEVRFIKGRLCFGDSKTSAPFPTAIVVFKKHSQKKTKFSSYEKP